MINRKMTDGEYDHFVKKHGWIPAFEIEPKKMYNVSVIYRRVNPTVDRIIKTTYWEEVSCLLAGNTWSGDREEHWLTGAHTEAIAWKPIEK